MKRNYPAHEEQSGEFIKTEHFVSIVQQGRLTMAKKETAKIDVDTLATLGLHMRYALEIIEEKLDEMGYSLDDFEEDEEYDEEAEEEEEEAEEEEAEEEEEESDKKKNPRFPNVTRNQKDKA